MGFFAIFQRDTQPIVNATDDPAATMLYPLAYEVWVLCCADTRRPRIPVFDRLCKMILPWIDNK